MSVIDANEVFIANKVRGIDDTGYFEWWMKAKMESVSPSLRVKVLEREPFTSYGPFRPETVPFKVLTARLPTKLSVSFLRYLQCL